MCTLMHQSLNSEFIILLKAILSKDWSLVNHNILDIKPQVIFMTPVTKWLGQKFSLQKFRSQVIRMITDLKYTNRGVHKCVCMIHKGRLTTHSLGSQQQPKSAMKRRNQYFKSTQISINLCQHQADTSQIKLLIG